MRKEIKGLLELSDIKATIGEFIEADSTAALGQSAAERALTGLSANSVFGAYRGSNFYSGNTSGLPPGDTTTDWLIGSLEDIQANVQATNHTIFLFDALGDPVASVDKDGGYVPDLSRGFWATATGKTSQVSVDKGAELDRMAKIAKANGNAGVTPGIRMASFALRPEVATNLSAPDRAICGPQESRSTTVHIASTDLRDERGVLIGNVSAISNPAVC